MAQLVGYMVLLCKFKKNPEKKTPRMLTMLSRVIANAGLKTIPRPFTSTFH